MSVFEQWMILIAISDRLDNETQVYTEGSARFIYGYGSALKQNRNWEVELIDIIKTESGT